ncbi:MAG TPA: ATP-binding protein [Thermoanaerobaculia bacterium]|nr:ATP-binding protein [Thermoanaerobaculia bacterium]
MRIFLGALVGFLIVLVALLLLLLQSFLQHTEEVIWENWQEVSTIAATEITPDSGTLDLQLSLIRGRFGIAGVTLITPRGQRHESGVPATQENVETVSRPTAAGTVVFVFDASRLVALQRTFFLTAVVSLFAASAGALLLLLYLPRITRPVEQMLDSASEISEREPLVDEQQYLIETFRNSIATMKAQETELKRLHDAQKSRADDLERVTAALTRSLSSGFLAVDPEGAIVDVNAPARDILQPAIADLAGHKLEEVFGVNDFTAQIADALANRAAIARKEIRIDARIVGLTTVPLLDEEQRFLGLLALFTDLTAFRELEKRVRELQSLADLGEISAGIAHEFRNALSTILGYLKLARRTPLPEDAERAITRSEAEASALSEAVNGLLAFARPMSVERRKSDLLEIVRDAAERVPLTESVALTIDGEPTIVEADASLLGRAIENLVRNAADAVAAKGSGTVRIRVSAMPSPRVVIEDDGIGVDPADIPRLLLPFQSDKPSGYGLGLPLARKIVLLHGGTLRLSGAKGEGATATIEL